MTQRLTNAFERLLKTSSSRSTVWHGKQPYNLAMFRKYLAVFCTVANFISIRRDSRTPAMRLELARQPLTYEDILWPGEVATRAPKGKAVQRPASPRTCHKT